MVLGLGSDLIEIARIGASIERFGARFLERVFTPAERAYCAGRVPSLAARWAAKEAVSKAFGTGIGKAMGWRDIDVHRHAIRVPRPGAEASCRSPPSSRTRSFIPTRPRPGRLLGSEAKPLPSSSIRPSTHFAVAASLMTTSREPACFTAFVRASCMIR